MFRRLAWFLAASFTVVVISILVVLFTTSDEAHPPAANQVEQFGQYLSEFQLIAQQLLGEPGRTYAHSAMVGPYSIRVAYDNSLGEVYFHESPRDGTSLGWNPGWTYAPHGRPSVLGCDPGFEAIGAGWYRFTNVALD